MYPFRDFRRKTEKLFTFKEKGLKVSSPGSSLVLVFLQGKRSLSVVGLWDLIRSNPADDSESIFICTLFFVH